MSRRLRHFNPAQVVGARGAWDARMTGLADGRMASWPARGGSIMAGPTQVAADNTRPVLTNGVRAYVQFQASEARRLVWLGASELATFQNQAAGILIACYQTGTLTGGTEFALQVSSGLGTTRLAILPASGGSRAAGGRRLDADSFVSATTGASVANQSVVHSGQFDWGVGSVTGVIQDGARTSAITAFSSGAGNTSNTASTGASIGADVTGLNQTNARLYAFSILRPNSPISSPAMRRIQQHYCVSFGIPYRS